MYVICINHWIAGVSISVRISRIHTDNFNRVSSTSRLSMFPEEFPLPISQNSHLYLFIFIDNFDVLNLFDFLFTFLNKAYPIT